MIVVIADDLTGAAEVAGIALRHGLDVRFATQAPDALPPEADVVVIATDTRSGSAAEARETVSAIASRLKGKEITLFKKVDSVLRGHVSTETEEICRTMGYSGAFIMPQNPSKGRIIADGVYTIDGTPLAETSFSYDPEFPAKSSLVKDLLPGAVSLPIESEAPAEGLVIADATTIEETKAQLGKLRPDQLLVGAGDTFDAFLPTRHRDVEESPADCSRAVIVNGSTQSRSLSGEPFVRAIGAETVAMTAEAFHGGDAGPWLKNLADSYERNGSVIMTIGHPATGGKAYAVRLRGLMADAVSSLATPTLLVIEGGATAYAVLERLGWRDFTVAKEYGPGVVALRHSATTVILKPGSYPWGSLFERETI